MSILFELERMERLAEDLDRLRRPVRIPVSCYKRMEGKEKGRMRTPRSSPRVIHHHESEHYGNAQRHRAPVAR